MPAKKAAGKPVKKAKSAESDSTEPKEAAKPGSSAGIAAALLKNCGSEDAQRIIAAMVKATQHSARTKRKMERVAKALGNLQKAGAQ